MEVVRLIVWGTKVVVIIEATYMSLWQRPPYTTVAAQP